MAIKGKPYTIPFGDRGMVAHPSRWRVQPGELTLLENGVVEHDLLQREPSATWYHPNGQSTSGTSGALEALRYGGPGASGPGWAGAQADGIYLGVWFNSTPQLTTGGFQNLTVSTGAVGAVSPFAIVLTGGCNAGWLHVVCISREAPGGVGGPTAVVDSKGHVYQLTVGGSLNPGTGLRADMWVAFLTVPLVAGDTLTVTSSDAVSDVNVIGLAYTGISDVNKLGFVAHTYAFAVGHIDFDTYAGTGDVLGPTHPYPVIGIGMAVGADPVPVYNGYPNFTIRSQTVVGNHRLVADTQYLDFLSTILSQVEFDSGIDTVLAGTVTTTKGSKAVLGAGTAFLTALRPGDTLIVNGEEQIVDVITTNVNLVVNEPYEQTIAGAGARRRAGPVLLTARGTLTALGSNVTLFMELPSNGTGTRGALTERNLGTSGMLFPRSSKWVIGGKEVAANLRKAFHFDGTNRVWIVDADPPFGAAAHAIANPPADWAAVADPNRQPINGVLHQDSLMAMGNRNDPHRLYISSPNDHEDFRPTSGGIQLRISAQVGSRLVGAAQYQGILFLWKYPKGIFYLDDSAIDRYMWGIRTRSTALGCAETPHAVLSIDDDVIFCDANGHFHLLSAVSTLGGTADSDLTRALGLQEWTQSNIHRESLHQLCSVYDASTKTAWFSLRSQLAADNQLKSNDLVMRFDFSRRAEAGIRVSTSRQWNADSLALKRVGYSGRAVVLIGQANNAWMVRPDSYGQRTDRTLVGGDVTGGLGYNVQTAECDLSDVDVNLRHVRKTFVALEVVRKDGQAVPPFGAMDVVTVQVYVDMVLRDTLTFGQAGVRRIMKPLSCGDGYSISFKITSPNASQYDQPLLGFVVYYHVAGTDHSRAS